MTPRGASGRSTRPKKLGPKQTVAVLRENEVGQIDFDAQRGLPTVETGVERAEENEYHLQAAISAAQAAVIGGKVKEAHIPTPPTIASNVPYDVLYPPRFSQPATYIRFSSTVEDCSGSPYCMDEADEIALKVINAKKHPAAQCSEDQFEELMNFFEETAHAKQPFAVVDNPPVVALEEMEEQLDETIDVQTKKFAREVYEHWKGRRIESGNKWLQPHLKFETGQDTDDADPYVCFRRREVRQVRKTRGRDAQSAEKLKKLRKEVEDGRQLLKMVLEREVMRKQSLAMDRELFRQRAEVKGTKRKLGIRGDDEDLINQKPKKKPDAIAAQQAIAPQRLFPITGRGPGDDLRLLSDMQAEQHTLIQREIQLNREKHIRWNTGFVDKTMAPLTPTAEKSFIAGSDFRHAMPATEYLPTPPASESSEPVNDVANDAPPDAETPSQRESFAMPFRYASPDEDEPNQTMPSFRRRIGRGGRTMFDRRIPFRTKDPPKDSVVAERYKFDSEDDDDNDVYDIDEYDIHIMQHRAYLFAKPREQETAQMARRAQLESATASSRPPAGLVNGIHPPISAQAVT